MLTTLFGRRRSRELETDKSYLRVDIKLNASLPHGQPITMPSKQSWQSWVREIMGRLEWTEPLLPDEIARENDAGLLEVRAWQEPPKITATCNETGELLLEAVSISAGQLVEVPRMFDDPDREPDDGPEEQLTEMFERVRASLLAWMQTVDHLHR